ncbi:MAG: ABC transporter permease subunit [Clostridiales bacterium]|nr:ABC transporter permease subunit [Clostridiales bacterium]
MTDIVAANNNGGRKPAALRRAAKALARDRYLVLMVLPALALLIVFRYIPLYGVVVAFQDYKPGNSFLGSEWVGLANFAEFINGPFFARLMANTFLLGFYSLVVGFPLPILLALSFNEVRNGPFKKIAQTVSYLPYFVSTVVIIGILRNLMDFDNGIINDIVAALGGERIKFFASADWFRTIYVGSGVWQSLGYSAIIYLAALSGIDTQIYESATIDGASRLRKLWHISLPGIMPTVLVLLILSVGGVFASDVQKVLLIYTPASYSTSDVIGTYIYRRGIEKADYSYSAAVGLFTNAISFVFLFATNMLSRKFGESSLW